MPTFTLYGFQKEKREGYGRCIRKIIAENFSNLKMEKDIQVQEAQCFPYKMNENRPTGRHILIKLAKVKDKKIILKAAREKQRVISREYP